MPTRAMTCPAQVRAQDYVFENGLPRQQQIRLHHETDPPNKYAVEQGHQAFPEKVLLDELLGADASLSLRDGDVRFLARVGGTDHPVKGDSLTLCLNQAHLLVFDCETGVSLAPHG